MSKLSEISTNIANFKSVTSKTILATQVGFTSGYISNLDTNNASVGNLTVSGDASLTNLIVSGTIALAGVTPCDPNGNTVLGDASPVSGVGNVYLGCGLTSTATGNLNVILGAGVAPSLTSGARNVVVGGNAGTSLLSGNGNVLIGGGAANLQSGSGNVFIVPATNACEGANQGGGNTVIGNILCDSDPSNSIMIGNGVVGNVGPNSLAFANLDLTPSAITGSGGAVPANVASYLPVWIGETEYRIPLFNP